MRKRNKDTPEIVVSKGHDLLATGGNKQAVEKYLKNQEKEDLISNQISMVEYYDPFEKCLKSNKEKKDNPKKK